MSTLPTHRRSSIRPRRTRKAILPRHELLESRELLSLALSVNSGQDTDSPVGTSLTLRLALEVSDGTVPVSSLSSAIQAQISGSLSYPAPNLITFAIPTTDSSYQSLATGRWTIEATKAEPTITSPVFVDASTQAGSSRSTAAQNLPAVFNADSTLQLDGYFATPTAPATTVDGLDITAGNSTIFGLIVTGFSGYGISISGSSAHSDGVYGSFIGTVPDYPNGVAFLHPGVANVRGDGNLSGGIRIQSSNNFIGDDTPADRNVIANNGNVVSDTGAGIQIDSTSATGNLVENSLILGNVAQGVLIESSNNTIGDSAGGFDYISGNGMQGILIEGNGSTNVQGNLVVGCQIGTYNDPSSASSFAILPNGSLYANSSVLDQAPSFAAGIDIEDSAKNTLGGLLPGARNYIAANYGDGVTINGSQSTGNRLENNWIGFDEYLINPGEVSLDAKVFYFPNQNGVSITAPGNFVGNGESAGLNVISNNSFNGIVLSGSTATRNVVSGNIIGLDPTGTYKIGNDDDGLLLENAPGNTIGGTTIAQGNTISGNNQGIVIVGAGSTSNIVEGNQIGTGLDGVTALGNANNGIWINGASSNLIGGTVSGAGNTISGNNVGVSITDALSPSSQANFNILQGNFIGTDTTSTVPDGNAIDGVYVSASSNTIGGTTSGAGNAIAYNGGVGVQIETGTGDAIRGNNIFSNIGSVNNIGDGSAANAGGGIYLDPINNANKLLPAPSPIAAAPDTTGINVQASYLGQPDTTYSFDFFASPTAALSGFGQGTLYLGTSTVTTNGSGLAQINADFTTSSPIPSGDFVSGTVTDSSGNTSAFSTNVVGRAGPGERRLGDLLGERVARDRDDHRLEDRQPGRHRHRRLRHFRSHLNAGRRLHRRLRYAHLRSRRHLPVVHRALARPVQAARLEHVQGHPEQPDGRCDDRPDGLVHRDNHRQRPAQPLLERLDLLGEPERWHTHRDGDAECGRGDLGRQLRDHGRHRPRRYQLRRDLGHADIPARRHDPVLQRADDR